jgi:hypothetical protein
MNSGEMNLALPVEAISDPAQKTRPAAVRRMRRTVERRRGRQRLHRKFMSGEGRVAVSHRGWGGRAIRKSGFTGISRRLFVEGDASRSGGLRSAEAHEVTMRGGKPLVIGLPWASAIRRSPLLGFRLRRSANRIGETIFGKRSA